VICRQLLTLAFRTAPNLAYTAEFKHDQVEFLFYASQFRPNKNVITLLRAFRHLLRDRYTGLKLFLTGVWEHEEIRDFVQVERLSRDVLFLHNLPVQQLAACYRLARVAVNPSISEGGFPFTFTESLSVGTPVVMSRIPVTEEVVTDPELASLMLFDPYDWRDMAGRIEWAIENRDLLRSKQMPLYDQLSQRTWREVVDDHIKVLDQIAAERADRSAVP
jgi:glycosyltransferase involved in cell wall biosynthesis